MNVEWNKVQAVILDLGGVILNIDYQATIAAYEVLGMRDFEQQYSKMQQSGLFDKLEKGLITEQEYVLAIQAALPGVHDQAIIDAWNAMLLDFPEGRIDTVKRIAEQWPTYLLSNTNAIHYKAFNRTLNEQTGLDDIKPLFKKAYLSHEIHERKPEARSFQIILEEQGLRPEEVLFIDDSPQHVEGARQLGLQAYHLVDPERLEDLFASFLA